MYTYGMDIQTLFFYVALGILGLTAVLEFSFPRFLKRHASRIFLYSVLFVGAYLIYIGYLQFKAFQSGVLSDVLGTQKGFAWFLNYTQLHFWNQYLLSFAGGILFFLIARFFNKKYHERFFENEELYLASLGILLVGYPGWFFYVPLILILSALVSLVMTARGERLPLYHFWIPVAIVFLVTSQLALMGFPWWQNLMASFRF